MTALALPADRLVTELLDGGAEPATLRLLWTATHGDPALMRAFVLAGLGTGELTCVAGRWRWGAPAAPGLSRLLATRAPGLPAAQLEALTAMTRALAEPYAVVRRARQEEPPRPQPPMALTPREREVLRLLGDGLTADAIGRRLGVSPRTVHKHQQNLYRKLGTTDRLAAVLHGQRLGLTARAG